MDLENPATSVDFESGWPCQRLRLGYGLVFFFAFEVTLGRQLPEFMPFVLLGLGLALLVSAMQAIRGWQLRTKLALIREAMERRGGSTSGPERSEAGSGR